MQEEVNGIKGSEILALSKKWQVLIYTKLQQVKDTY